MSHTFIYIFYDETRSVEFLLLYLSDTFLVFTFFTSRSQDAFYDTDLCNLSFEDDFTADSSTDWSWVFMQLIDFFFISEAASVGWTKLELLLRTIIDSEILLTWGLHWVLREAELGLVLEKELFLWILLKLTSLDLLVSSWLLSVVSSQFSSMLLITRIDFFFFIFMFFSGWNWGFLNFWKGWMF